MKRLTATIAGVCVLGLLLATGAAAAEEFDQYRLESASSSLSTTQAGAHPDFTTAFRLSSDSGEPYAFTRDVEVVLPPGLFGNPQAFPKCTPDEFGTAPSNSACPQDSQLGITEITLPGGTFTEPVYNMPAPGGDVVARLGFYASIYPTFINVRLDPSTYQLVARVEGASATIALLGSSTTLWGVPAAESHDRDRVTPAEVAEGTQPLGGRKSNLPETPFMTNPSSCEAGREVVTTVTSYQLPESPQTKTAAFPQITGCGVLGFSPQTTLAPTTEQGTTGSGLSYGLSFPTKGLEYANLPYDSEQKRAEVILPQGMSVNPSQAEGIGVCSEADFARESFDSAPGAGCPESSKIGSVSARTPVLDEDATGSLYLAKPYENPVGSLIALYMTVKVPNRGISVKLAGKVSTDPATGQITAVFDGIPQLPVSEFQLNFREGARAPLVTPPACGPYTAVSNFTPWADLLSNTGTTNSFQITSGPDHGPCPNGGLPPFHPSLFAGTVNNAAGSYSPFDVRLSRTDSEQEITHFSIKLPPGVIGKLAGVPYCSDAAIAVATARTGPHGGAEELERPSCPQASEVGHSLAGAGVGSVLAYASGKMYLAGPYHGSNISLVSITAAKVGPFDLGTVVVRFALKINPETAEVFVDSQGSDPIPHIIQGIPVHLRDIRAYVDKPEFVLNPTSCAKKSTASTVLGSGLDFASEADDQPVTVTSPFQAADCANLGFAPKLAVSLRGGTKRGATPAFKAVLTYPKGAYANIAKSVVTLPHSEFLEQAHIKTICTRAQFKEGTVPGEKCPAASIYGRAEAITPLLSEPLKGPVYLRSSSHNLPDLVAALHNNQVDFALDGRIDSVKNGRIRNTFETVPDAPVSKFVLEMQGGKKGLLVNSTDLCTRKNRAISEFTGQNGKLSNSNPVLTAQCGKHAKKKGKHSSRQKRAGR